MTRRRKSRLDWIEERKTSQVYLFYLQGYPLKEAMTLLNVKVSLQVMVERLRVRYGADYAKKNGVLKVLAEEYLNNPEYAEVTKEWLESNKARIAQLEVDKPITVYTENYMNNQTLRECGKEEDALHFIDITLNERNEHYRRN